MKTASVTTLAILNAASSNNPVKRADLYEITLRSGTVLRLTDADRSFTVGGYTYEKSVLIRRSQTTQTIGVEASSIKVHIDDDGGVLVAGKPIIHQFKNGVFDYAKVIVRKLFLSSWNDVSGGAVDWFEGEISNVQCGQISVDFDVKNAIVKLNQQMPRAVAQPTCNNSLFRDLCGANKAANTFTGTSSSIVSRSKFSISGVSQPDGQFALGKVTFTSGANANLSRTVKRYTSGQVETFQPFPYDIAAGDGVTIYSGCDKLQGTCSTKFATLSTLDAFPYIPVPETAIAGGAAPAGAVASPGTTGTPVVGSRFTGMKAPKSYTP